jgi:hypothetical protein
MDTNPKRQRGLPVTPKSNVRGARVDGSTNQLRAVTAMAKDEAKPRKSPPFTIASLYLAAGLAVCFIVLTRLIPTTAGVLDERAKKSPEDSGGWHAVTMALSQLVTNHPAPVITMFAIIATFGFVLPFLVRPSRYLVWIAALIVIFFDLTLLVIGFGHMLSGLLKEAGSLTH